ncbi:hypothetical protein [Bacteroides ilei]|uniref:hypothetical protein n=1 Tax=Bacteroides ilei TaxID=1907658 RepID=UPI000A76355D|nr:hypothetical protein [Bacteroides ilei]
MRKKYLSALLFGALLFASAGTFTSCKDYDDDINNLQTQITANADAIKALQELVNNGDYVTKVAKNADGNLVFTFSKSGDQIITLDEEQVGDVLSINAETGELIKNGEPTGWFATKNEEKEQQNCIKVGEDGCWQLLQDDGSYKSTNIPVSGVTAVQNTDTKEWTLTIVDAQGKSNQVVIPSAASVMSNLELVGWIESDAISDKNELSQDKFQKGPLTVYYYYIDKITPSTNPNKEITWSAQKDVTKHQVLTTLAAKGTQLVTRVSPADLNMSDMKFTLQDSKGNELPITLNAAENFTGLLTRASNSSINLIPLDVTSDTYASADKYTDLFNNSENKNNIVYSLVEASGARSTYASFDIVAEKYDKDLEVPKVTATDPEGTTADDETGNGEKDTPFIIDLNTPTKLVFEEPEQVYDYYVEAVDATTAKEFGFSTDKKAGTITLTKASDPVSKAGLELKVYALRLDGQVHESYIWVKPSSIMDAAVTLNAGEKLIAPIFANGVITNENDGYTMFTVSLDEMFSKMTATDKERWQSAVMGANNGIVITSSKNYSFGQGKDGDIKIKFADAQGHEQVNNKDVTNANAEALNVYIKYTNGAKAILTPDKEVSLNVAFNNKDNDGDITVLNTIGIKVTPVLPEFSTFFTKKTELWNDDASVLMAYFNDPTSNVAANTTLTSTFNITQGFKTFGLADYAGKAYATLTLTLDDQQKLYNKNVMDGTNSLATLNGNEITLNTNQKTYKSADRPDEVVAYNEDLNIKMDGTYLGVYKYSQVNEDTKKQVSDATFKIKVQSALAAGYIKALQGASIVMEPAAAGEIWKVTAEHVGGYTYSDQPYSLFKVATAADKSNYKYTYISSVQFKPSDKSYYQIVDANGNETKEAINPVWDVENKKESVASYVALKPGNTTQEVNTYLRVTVTDVFGYSLTVDVPLTINKAK